MEKVTIYSIVEELGMSPSMVSRALSTNGSVNPEKKKLIIKTAEKHGFIPNKFASRLSGKHIKIGVLLYVRYRPVTDKIISGIKEAYDELKDYKIEYEIKIVEKSKKRARDCEEELFSLVDCDGVLVFGLSSKHCTDMLMRFYEKNLNLVQVQSVNADVKHEIIKIMKGNTENESKCFRNERTQCEVFYSCRSIAERRSDYN